ncbi:MAG: Aklavinone 12-hydroxylase RdmE [Luteibacter sp.]|uniref:FAD-dependent monooxygenase n=1 Tax=Luteibacter sp. TaxID=1886636 RepID=UPI001384EAFC|nr:FAD-dependent monooxygenase [Luteibacter sp.]KAF1004736.1 MAG: Aklavinone 12-hydroxylase RdmE [Luteibacter sp.]
MQHTQVIIIGGSLVGLSASLFLSSRGVANIVVDKHHGSSPHPRAMGFTERTLEYFRAVGLGDAVPQVAPGTRLRRARVESLAGTWHDETPWTPGQPDERRGEVSPCTGAAIPQDKLEPILRDTARERGALFRLGCEMLSFVQDQDGVTVVVRDRDTGQEETLRGAYLIAADGADSGIREALGIRRQGVGYLRTLRSVLFRCAEADRYLERGIQQFEINQDGFHAFLTTYGDGRWVLMFDDDRERDTAELEASVRRALGSDDADFSIITTGRWVMAGLIAERYSEGRIFLAGDAAHQLPPTRGGFGANTGIDDAYNLAWKLDRVLRGASSPRLLETYSAERQPIGWLRHQQTFARPDYARWTDHALKDETILGDEAMELGQLLRSEAIIGAGPELPPAAHPDAWQGQPGTRAPHIWITQGERTLSTLDLFGKGWVLLFEDERWSAACAVMPEADIITVRIGEDIVFPGHVTLASCFGIDATGATLIRPDGIVAWRSPGMPSDPAAALTLALHDVAMPMN